MRFSSQPRCPSHVTGDKFRPPNILKHQVIIEEQGGSPICHCTSQSAPNKLPGLSHGSLVGALGRIQTGLAAIFEDKMQPSWVQGVSHSKSACWAGIAAGENGEWSASQHVWKGLAGRDSESPLRPGSYMRKHHLIHFCLVMCLTNGIWM